MICCFKEKLEQKLELELTLEQKLELTLELVGSGGKTTKSRFCRMSAAVFIFVQFLTDACSGFPFSDF